MPSLIWFRNDLRTCDNAALACAAKDRGADLIGLFVVCEKQWLDHDWGPVKIDFMLRNVEALAQTLARLNIPLVVVREELFETVPKRVLEFARRHHCDRVYFNQEHEVNELERDEQTQTLLRQSGIEVHSYVDQTILDVANIQTRAGSFYTVFTPFKKTAIQAIEEGQTPAEYPSPGPLAGKNPVSTETGLPVPASKRNGRPDLWPAGEDEAQKRLQAFVAKKVAAYDEQRDAPSTAGTSLLSPYLAAGVLSPRQCLRAAIHANHGKVEGGSTGITTWISELLWRDFYRHILIGFPRVCRHLPFRLETDRLNWRTDESQFEAWCDGRTGVPIVDAGMRQLVRTGWMHNRVRMIAAMYLSKNLFIDWRWGERFFMQHLVDGDFASNNGGWQWSASTGTDAVPYFRMFNPHRQSQRFDPEGTYIRKFVTELKSLDAKQIHEPHATVGTVTGYTLPLEDQKRSRQRVIEAFKSLKK